MLKIKTILNEINNKNLNLHSDYGYFYFTYSDIDNDTFETREVYVRRLKDLTFSEWIAKGQDFISDIEYQIWSDDISKYQDDLDVIDVLDQLMG
jgi:cobalamin biosynthesis Co2+ chelatase CbiK